MASLKSSYESYKENFYGKVVRITDDRYRKALVSWQVPALIKHFGSLAGKAFIDIGAGDIVLGEELSVLGRPSIFYAQDLNQASLDAGIERIVASGNSADNIITLCSDNFDFDSIPDRSLDCAFSNSLFSHLSINSIVLCLRKLAPKMQSGARYLSSMILIPSEYEPEFYDWSALGTEGSEVVSFLNKDPFHYTPSTLDRIVEIASVFDLVAIHDYGHPFQKLVEFQVKS